MQDTTASREFSFTFIMLFNAGSVGYYAVCIRSKQWVQTVCPIIDGAHIFIIKRTILVRMKPCITAYYNIRFIRLGGICEFVGFKGGFKAVRIQIHTNCKTTNQINSSNFDSGRKESFTLFAP
eukprot:NODE_190_length_15503_cov_0.365814.p11 type:complete len:123 gc:universal NODE_190_length_15503_cov_0.365814:8936-9304(+)